VDGLLDRLYVASVDGSVVEPIIFAADSTMIPINWTGYVMMSRITGNPHKAVNSLQWV
jgi:hypothetical protein